MRSGLQITQRPSVRILSPLPYMEQIRSSFSLHCSYCLAPLRWSPISKSRCMLYLPPHSPAHQADTASPTPSSCRRLTASLPLLNANQAFIGFSLEQNRGGTQDRKNLLVIRFPSISPVWTVRITLISSLSLLSVRFTIIQTKLDFRSETKKKTHLHMWIYVLFISGMRRYIIKQLSA